MKIKFRETGGFAGLKKSGFFDLDAMPEAEREEYRVLIEQARVFELSEPPRQTPRVGADREQYSVTFEDNGRSRRFDVTAGAIPAELEAVIRFLSKRAKYEKR